MKSSIAVRSTHRGRNFSPSNRRERRRVETRERIYRAALRIFAQRGYLDTTVEDITEAADVGKGTFFNYFPTKEHVLATYGDERLAAIERALKKARTPNQSVRPVLRELATDLAGQSSESPGLATLDFRGTPIVRASACGIAKPAAKRPPALVRNPGDRSGKRRDSSRLFCSGSCATYSTHAHGHHDRLVAESGFRVAKIGRRNLGAFLPQHFCRYKKEAQGNEETNRLIYRWLGASFI